MCFRRLGPYHHARLRAASARRRVTAVEFCDVDSTYAWSTIKQADVFEKITVFEGTDVDKKAGGEIGRRVQSALERLDPEIVAVPGWSHPGALAALRWCLTASRPAILMSDSTQHDQPRYALSEAVKRRVVRLYGAALVAGRPQRAYVRGLGLRDDVIFEGYDVVDNRYFMENAARVREDAMALRRAYQLPRHFFLASSRFVKKKNLIRLLDAYALYRRSVGQASWPLVLLGDGEMRPAIENCVRELGLNTHVSLRGFKQYEELPIYFGLASAFVHASTSEQWGLVINEAMASGLPVLVSERCGCAPDLVEEGVNGYTFDPYNVEELANRMTQLAGTAEQQRTAMGHESERIISSWGLDRFAEGLVEAIEAATTRLPPRSAWLDSLMLGVLIRR